MSITTSISSDKIYPPVGAYSAAVKVNCGDYSMIHTSGFIGIDPKTLAIPDNVCDQCNIALTNLSHLLNDNSVTFRDIAKVTIFLTDMNDFADVNKIYSTFFDEKYYPARACVQVSRLPKDAKVEIEAICYVSNKPKVSSTNKKENYSSYSHCDDDGEKLYYIP